MRKTCDEKYTIGRLSNCKVLNLESWIESQKKLQ